MIKNKRAEGEITQLTIATLVVAMFAVGIIGFAVDMDRNYDLNFDESEFASFQRISSIQENITLSIQRNVEEGSGTIAPLADVIEGQARAGFKSTKLLLEIPSIMKDLILDTFLLFSARTGLDLTFQFGIIAIIAIIVTSSILALIFKLRP